MLGRLHARVGLLDLAVGADQVADPLRGAGPGVVAGAVGEADLAVGVAEQREVVVELLREGRVGLLVVEADPEDLDALLVVLGLEVAEPATLLGSAGGVGLRVEIDDELLTLEILQRNVAAAVARQLESRGFCAFGQLRRHGYAFLSSLFRGQ